MRRGAAPLRICTADLKARIDLLDLAERDTQLRKVAGTRGGEYAGPCPSCGGHDRFRVQPERGLWFCRGCRERWADAIEYVRWRYNVGFREAIGMLGGGITLRATPIHRHVVEEPLYEPSPAWKGRAAEVVAEAAELLWSDVGTRALDYLRGRGLGDETIARFAAGYIPADRYEQLAVWGLDAEPRKRVWLPRGIVLPWIVDGDEVWCLKVRRPADRPKYIAVKGSIPTIFGTRHLRGHRMLVLPEGELDAMLLWQEAGDLADVATMGSAGKKIDPRAARFLDAPDRVLLAYDGDQAGADGAERRIAESAKLGRLGLPEGQDITDYHLAGGDLRRLVAGALA